MPSLRTRQRYQALVLDRAEASIAAASAALETATDTLEDIEAGTLDLDAVTIGGQRFINDGGTLVVEP
jgi:S-adenosylmethionine:tRNA-ribosyltransferase-isomerase (queuine synthetase)